MQVIPVLQSFSQYNVNVHADVSRYLQVDCQYRLKFLAMLTNFTLVKLVLNFHEL